MKVVNQSFEIIDDLNTKEIYQKLEKIIRVCYKSEDKIIEDGSSAENLIKQIMIKEHYGMLEHILISVKFITSRGVANELVRHRMASYAQESTRYCNYAKNKFNHEITVIAPPFNEDDPNYILTLNGYKECEQKYFELLESGVPPEFARNNLPLGLKTEIVATANLHSWRNIFALRTSVFAHPEFKQLLDPLLIIFHEKLPLIFPQSFYECIEKNSEIKKS